MRQPVMQSSEISTMRRRDLLGLGLTSLSLAALGAPFATAQSRFPEGPIKLIVPRAAGGVVDVVARFWAEQVKPHLGNVVIENQGGGGGIIAANAVARAKPDGHTLLAGTTTELVISPAMATVAYDPQKDLAPIAITAVSISALMVHESLPVKTLKELVDYGKANPGKLSYGSAGVGTSAHLCGELFKHLAGLPDIVHVPYRGANPGLADFYAGHLPMFAASISPQVIDMHRRGRIRILVAGNDRHLAGAPEIPTNVEAGFPELVTLMFMGLFATGGTPRPIIDQIASVTRVALADKDFQKKLIDAGFEPVIDSGPEQTGKFVQDELARWTPLLKTAGIKLN
jgi:tripartite-type tricarboxylate transporter receptor subunit TctC